LAGSPRGFFEQEQGREIVMQKSILNAVIVERRRIARRYVAVELPMPPFLSSEPGALERGQNWIEQRWRSRAATALRNSRARVLGPVEIRMVFDARQRHKPMSSLLKPILDVLVQFGVIDGQSSAIVRRLTLEWGAADSVLVEIMGLSQRCEPPADLVAAAERKKAAL